MSKRRKAEPIPQKKETEPPRLCWIYIEGGRFDENVNFAVIVQDRSTLVTLEEKQWHFDSKNLSRDKKIPLFDQVREEISQCIKGCIWLGFGNLRNIVDRYFNDSNELVPRPVFCVDFEVILQDHLGQRTGSSNFKDVASFFEEDIEYLNALDTLKVMMDVAKRACALILIESAHSTAEFSSISPPLSDDVLVWFDLETSIVSKNQDFVTDRKEDIIDVGIILMKRKNLKQVPNGEYETLVYQEEVNEETQKLTKITPEMLRNEKKFVDVARKIFKMTNNRIWIGHNMKAFDSRVLASNFMRTKNPKSKVDGFMIPPKEIAIVDTLTIFRDHFCNRAGSNKLDHICKLFGFEDEKHRALSDVKDNIKCFFNASLLIIMEESDAYKHYFDKYDPIIPKKIKTTYNKAFNPFAVVSSEKTREIVYSINEGKKKVQACASESQQKKFIDFVKNEQMKLMGNQTRGGTGVSCVIRYNNGSEDRKVTNITLKNDDSFMAKDERGQSKRFLIKSVLDFGLDGINRADTRKLKKKRSKKE